MTAVARVLDRLERVKRTGTGRWVACSPAHKDRSPSLSVRALEDGRVLIHDFGGCEVEQVLSALGLTLSDLFEKPLGHSFPQSHSSIPARDVLVALDHEIQVTVLILGDIVATRRASKDQVERLAQAAARVSGALDMINPARTSPNA
jgi:hypothetical protein